MANEDAAVVICIYNRPSQTRRVIDAVRKAKPRRLLVVADGPKDDPADKHHCVQARAAVLEHIDWTTDVQLNFSDINLGLRKRISTGLDWVFDRVEDAIILEDDCLPDPTFFRFCAELLERYRYETRVGLIAGSTFAPYDSSRSSSYHFSKYPLIWGWATWRRTWHLYDLHIGGWPELRNSGWLDAILADPIASTYWRQIFERVVKGYDTWDYSLVFSCWKYGLLTVQPCSNLVSNIGFDLAGTHTKAPSLWSEVPVLPMPFPLRHPEVKMDDELDRLTEAVLFSGLGRRRWQIAERLASLRN